MTRRIKAVALAFFAFCVCESSAFADITIGVTLSATGPAA